MKHFFYLLVFLSFYIINAQKIPSKKVIEVDNLINYLKQDVHQQLSKNRKITTEQLATYFKEKFSERYFYDWRNVENRFEDYQKLYASAKQNHVERAKDHLAKYPAKTVWKLPFKYQNGKSVNAYALRHLARQHKMVDIAFYYFYEGKNKQYINYFTEQLASLNTALYTNQFEKIEDGNGVYEAFRSGYRVLNWLQIHNLFLGEKTYSNEEQLTTIATLLQHASYLYERNQQFKSGNHQTRGLSALAMVAILLRDFVDTDVWYNHAMQLLQEHLSKEINEDGFQFERTVHYHMSDIGNYFYVYQLVKNSNLKVNLFWERKLASLFSTLTKIAFPDKFAPVFSDDTDTPWAEKNDISNALTLGYLLFAKPEFGYFSNTSVSRKMFWYVNENQLKSLETIKAEKPVVKSTSFDKTGYYIFREGWNSKDKMLVVSAGVDAKKPDHQHGDVMGIQVFANENVILPNYQVRYSLNDLELFKNSLTKNIALVDDELQGKKYKSNKGGSGFGKFKELPTPKVIAFDTKNDIEFFAGSHDGFENVGVHYSRQIINVENDFWIVKDNFSSEKKHNYKQIWQGHYSKENAPNLLRSTFQNGSGLDIYQLNKIDSIETNGARGKHWNIVSKKDTTNFSFITLLHPFESYNKRIDESTQETSVINWQINKLNFDINAEITLSKNNKHLLFSAKRIIINNLEFEFSKKVDLIVSKTNKELIITSISTQSFYILFKKEQILIEPTENKRFILK